MVTRRRHSKIDDLPDEIVSAINDAIVNKRKTYKQIEQWLKNDGYEVHQSSLQRYGKNFLSKLERITQAREQAREQAKTIIETSSGLKTEMAEATSTVAFQILMDMLINSESVDKNTLQAINTLATLERSTVAREKLKLEYDKGVSAAIDEVKRKLSKELESHPEILERIINIADSLKDDLKAYNQV